MKQINSKVMVFSFLYILACSFSLQAATAQVESDTKVVQTDQLAVSSRAADKWLKLVDSGKYGQSWDTGAIVFKFKVPRSHWISLMNSIRKPLGNLNTRKVLEQREAKDPQGLPRGDYMMIIYDASFSARDSAHELVTLALDEDGVWRVLTYHVQ